MWKKVATTMGSIVILLATTGLACGEITTKKMKIGNTTLNLNGSGTRMKAFVHSIYEAGLYLPAYSQDAKKVVSADELMAIRIKITSGFVSRSALLDSLNEGLDKSTRGQSNTIQAEKEKFVACLNEEVQKNDIFDFVYAPAKGLYIMKNGNIKGIVPGLKFKQAFFGIWLSDTPADSRLKQALLTGEVRR